MADSWWPGKNREAYFISGLMVAGAIAGFISNYWNFSDRAPLSALKKNAPVRQQERPAPENVKEPNPFEYSAPPSGKKENSYYKLGEETSPAVPRFEPVQKQ